MKGGEFGIRKSAISREREREREGYSFRFLICEVGSEGALLALGGPGPQ